jgi:bacillolysin
MKSKYRWINIVFSFIFVFSLFGVQNQQVVAAKSVDAFSSQDLLLQAACLDGNRGIVSAADTFTGETQFIGTRAGEPIRLDAALKGGSPEDAARAFLSQCGGLFGLQDASNELSLKKERLSEDGQRTMVRFQQEYQGVPVVAGELFVQFNAQMDILAVGGEVLPRLYVDTTPTTDAAVAMENALASVAKQYQWDISELTSTEPILKIYDAALLEPWDGPTLLVWEMEITKVDAINVRQYVLVNAQRGNVVVSFNKVDFSLDLATYDNNGAGTLPPLPAKLECTEADLPCTANLPADLDAKAAHRGAANTYNFYFNQHGRDSFDNAGGQIISVVDWDNGVDCPNAFWNGTQMVYCDTLGVSDDVVAHELTHAVTENESGLFYYYQSGAINESLSDVWGEFVDQTSSTGFDTDGVAVDWQMGEDATAFGGAIRNMEDPTLFGDPDMMSSVNYNEVTCADAFDNCDNGGVHSNSGVNNKAAYLMVEGGIFNSVTVAGIGMYKTAAIYYEVQTNLLTSGSDYRDLHDALIQACNSLVGTTPPNTSQIIQADCDDGVSAAVEAVEMDEEPAVNYNPEAPVCDSGSQVNLLSDDLETASYNWNFAGVNNTSNVTDYQRWFKVDNFFATSGISSIYGDDYDYDGGNATSDTFVAMQSRIYIPPSLPNAYLRFNHAYGFEDGGGTYWDGGRVEYSVDNGTTWLDAGTMIDSAAYGYNGVVSNLGPGGPNTSKNPLKNKSAFVGDSHGYISSRLDLASLLGQSVLFRWRMGTDQIGYDWGWWVDDVQLYSCAAVAPTILTSTFKSQAANDGWLLESTEASNKGNTVDTALKLQVGDNGADRQYKSIVSFDTSSLPDTAVIVSATLKVRRSGGFIGQNPFNTHGILVADVRQPNFGSSAALIASDFQAPVSLAAVSSFGPTPALQSWYSANVSAASPYIYVVGTTQFRLRFSKDDNDDMSNDYIRFYSGETPGSAPQLIIEYYIP